MTDHLSASYPVLPLRDIVVFPHMIVPLFVGREKSVRALEEVMADDKQILLSSQIDPSIDDPTTDGIYRTGVLANVLQLLKLPDGTVKVLVEGVQRARVVSVTDEKTHYVAEAVPIPADAIESTEVEAMRRAMLTQFDQYVKLNKKIPPEILTSLSGIDEPGRLADTVAAHLPLKLDQKQAVLEMFEVKKRLEHLLSLMEAELDILF